MSGMTAHQSPARSTVLSMTDIVGNWWPGVSRTCPNCRGRLWLNVPTLGVHGDISCLLCEREYAEVVEQIVTYGPLTAEDLKPRRGRAPMSAEERREANRQAQERYAQRKREGVAS